MAVAVFPPGGPGVKYPAPNGITYIWDEDNERWNVLSTKRQIKTITIISDREPENVVSGDLWYDTTVSLLKVYVNDHWDSVGETPDLQKVTENGNITDKGILLTDETDALIAIVPKEALIDIASDTSKKNPRIRLTHIDTANYPDSQAQIELDQDGTRVDFEFDQAINDVHFRFDDEEKLVLNKEGDAAFTGKSSS